MPRVRTPFLSDIHLGTRACQADRLLDFLRQYPARQTYLIGDIIDFWSMSRSIHWSAAQNTVVQKMLRRARHGERVVFIPGNHDEALRDYCGIAFGDIEIAEERVHETADGRRFLIHGDAFDQVTRHHRWAAVAGDPEDRLVGWRAMHRAVEQAAADCDLVHIQTPFVAHYAGLKAARRHGIPAIATYHTLFEEYLQHYASFLPKGWVRSQARAFSRRQCNALDGVVVPSTAMQERLKSYGVTAPTHVLPTGIPLSRFTAGDGAAFRQRHGIEPGRPVALFVGRVAHEKNIGFLLEAMVEARRNCPGVLLVITGEGPAREDLGRQAASLGIADSVRFVGYLDRARELPACYAAADIFVFASRTETQGLVLLEAMATGLPVMALSAMGTSDILDPGRGCLSPPDDPMKFGQALSLFLERREAWAGLAQDAAAHAAEWSDDAMAKRLACLYQNLHAGRSHPVDNLPDNTHLA